MDNQQVLVNKLARKQRHSKLFDRKILGLKRLFQWKSKGVVQDKELESFHSNRDVKNFLWKSSATILAFFLFSTIFPTYAYTQDILIDDSFDLASEFSMGKIATTNDGFLLNNTGQSELGDRTSMTDAISYKVEPGDTLSKVAQKFHLDVSTIVWANNISDVNQLAVGKELIILPVDGIFHQIAKNDTLDSIAKKYKVQKDNIISQNKLDARKLVAGESIIIPGGKIEVERIIAFNRESSNRGGAPVLTASNISDVSSFQGGGAINFIKPTAGKLTQGYHRGHYAIDIGNRNKGPVYAAASGKIIKASYGWNGGYGNVVIVDHGNNVQTLYAHNEVLYVKEGDFVSQGQTISWMGNTGRVYGQTGIHLHFEVIVNGVKKNPLSYFSL